MGLIRNWDDEYPEGQELYVYDAGEWSLGVWLTWTKWGLGPEVEREYGSPGGFWPDRLHAGLWLGPISLSAVRTWNERDGHA